jgi:hypothetical protein
VPQQALALANSELSVRMSRVLAAKIGVSENSAEFVNRAFGTILGRPPSEQERSAALEFLNKQPDRLASWQVSDPTAARARENLVHVLLNHNDFVTIR